MRRTGLREEGSVVDWVVFWNPCEILAQRAQVTSRPSWLDPPASQPPIFGARLRTVALRRTGAQGAGCLQVRRGSADSRLLAPDSPNLERKPQCNICKEEPLATILSGRCRPDPPALRFC